MHRQHQLPGSYCCRVVSVSAKEARTTITADMDLRFTFIAKHLRGQYATALAFAPKIEDEEIGTTDSCITIRGVDQSDRSNLDFRTSAAFALCGIFVDSVSSGHSKR